MKQQNTEDRRNFDNIVLEGFMGCGKSSVGRLVASLTGYSFVDTDSEIETRMKQSIQQIIESGDLSELRKIEETICLEVSDCRGYVIATGGGAFTDPNIAQAMRRHGMVFCLERDFELVYPLISNDPCRPLAYGKTREDLRRLLENRLNVYHHNADRIVQNHDDINETARLIVESFCQAKETLKKLL